MPVSGSPTSSVFGHPLTWPMLLHAGVRFVPSGSFIHSAISWDAAATSGALVPSPEVAIRVVELFRKTQTPEQFPAGLAPQELRLLKLLTEGHQNKTVAAELGISIHTVSFHLRSIYEKLHVHSRSEAVARALREGWVH